MAGAGWSARLRRWLRPPRKLTFTRDGRLFVLVTVAIGFGAVNTGTNLLYLLLGWTLAMIVASGLLSERNLAQVAITRRPPAQVFANQPFLMEIAVENRKPSMSSFSLEVEELVAGRPLDKKCYFLKVPPGRTQRTSYRHTFSRRGLQRLDGFRLGTKFPFGLFCKSRDLDAPGEVLVYPALTPVARPPAQARTSGEQTSGRVGRHGEFLGLRPWRDGDEVRDVHWRSTARAGRTVVREYEDELTRRAVVIVDHGVEPGVLRAADDAADPELAAAARPALDAVERAISHAASVAAAYLEAGWVVELVARGQAVPAGAGRQQLARVLRALALLPPTGVDTPFARFDARADTVLVTARGAPAVPRPKAGQVVEA